MVLALSKLITQHKVARGNNGWLGNQENVSERNDMSTCGLLQLAEAKKSSWAYVGHWITIYSHAWHTWKISPLHSLPPSWNLSIRYKPLFTYHINLIYICIRCYHAWHSWKFSPLELSIHFLLHERTGSYKGQNRPHLRCR